MPGIRAEHVDFDEMRALAERDPVAFEQRRQELIAAAISRVSKQRQRRMLGLQWRIEQARRQAPTPLAACILLSNMMWESFAGERGLQSLLMHGPSFSPRTSASILSFHQHD